MNLTSQTRICVTGGNGFLGRQIVRQLEIEGCGEIYAPHSYSYDLRYASCIKDLFANIQPDIIIHAAAHVGGIGLNQAKPGELFYDNAIMGIQLMEEARRFGIRKFVQIGTICSYPNLTPVPFKESDLWSGYPEETNAPYGLAKKMLLVQGQAYRKQYGFNSIHLMPVNLYGPHDNFDPQTSHVIPALIHKFLTATAQGASQVTIWGDGSASREFLYVEDCAEAIVKALRYYDGDEPINIGTGSEISIKELTGMIANLVDFRGEIVYDASKPNGQPRRCLDTQRAETEFGFKARTSLEDGLRRTIAWYTGGKQ